MGRPAVLAVLTGTTRHRAQLRRTSCPLLVAVVAATTVVGCSSAGGGNGGAAPARPVSAWQAVLNQVQPDGGVSTATALAAFTLAIGPVPGAAVPAGPAELIPSGTLAVSWVLRRWADLSPAQQAAVAADLRQPPPSPPTGNGPSRGRSAVTAHAVAVTAPTADPNQPCLSADSAGAEKYRAMLPDVQAALAAKLGRPLTVAAGTYVSVNTKDLERTVDGHPALMYTLRCTKPGTAVTAGCTIHVNASTAAAGAFSDAELRSFLLHEMTHCFLTDKLGARYETLPSWYVEGVPTWTTSVIGGSGSDRLSGIWTRYLDTPTTPLSQRTYDGLGFFVHLAETGTDPWRVIDPIGAALAANPSTAAGFAAAGVTPEFLRTWGSGFLQGRYPGAAWTSGGPNLPRYAPALGRGGQLVDGATLNLTAPAFAATIDEIDVKATVVMLAPGAGTAGRISLGGGTDATVDNGGPYCTIAQCACPAGAPGAGTTFTRMQAGQAYVGFTGGAAAGSLALVGISLPDFCAKPPTPCIVGQWTGVRFDVTLKDISETGGAGVKLRITPTGDVTVVFDGMKPVVFTQSGSPGVKGTFVYNGTITGRIRLPAGGASTGTWDYASPSDTKGLTATVHVTSPITVDLGPLDLVALAGSFGGGAVSSQPLISGGWSCSGDTMTTTPPPGSPVAGTWTLTRTGG